MNSLQEQTTPGQMTLTITCFGCGKTVTRELDIYDTGINWEITNILHEVGYTEHNGKHLCAKCFNAVCI